MKKYKFACEKLAYGMIISGTIFYLAFATLAIYLGASDDLSGMLFVAAFVIFVLTPFVLLPVLFFRNVFCRYRITKNGVENKYTSVKWSDVQSYQIVPVRYWRRRVCFWKGPIEYPSLLVLGKVGAANYLTLDRRESVFFSLTRENLEAVNKYCEEKNETVSEILEKYMNVV